MHWLFLLLGFAALAFAIKTTSSILMVLGMLAALGLWILWLAGLYSARMAGGSRDPSSMIDPAELRRLREQAEARKAAARYTEPPAPRAPRSASTSTRSRSCAARAAATSPMSCAPEPPASMPVPTG